jgi:23S rRNA (uracil1939-C5)-methyltransferase
MELWQRIRANRAKLPADVSSVVLRQDRNGGLHVVAVGGSQPWKGSALAAAIGGETVSVWWKPAGGAARIIAGERTGFPALAFEQANPALAASIREDVVAALGDVSGRVVWDLYGGVGDTARALAARGAGVWSVDADRSAIEWAEAQGDVITYIAARAEDALRKLPEPDAIVVNPPRTGLDARVSAYLDRWGKGAASPVNRVAYVSCDPATLARDLRRIPSLRLASVVAYDLFPQTAHVERLAVLEGR